MPDSTLMGILFFILPGLIGVGTYRLLTTDRPMQQLDILALGAFFTLGSVSLVTWSYPYTTNYCINDSNNLTLSIINCASSAYFWLINIVSILLGIIVTVISNQRWVFRIFRKFCVTYKSGEIDVWQDYFRNTLGQWVQIQLINSDDVMIGYAKYVSDIPVTDAELPAREIYLINATLYKPDNSELKMGDVYLPGTQIAYIFVIAGKDENNLALGNPVWSKFYDKFLRLTRRLIRQK